MVVMVMTFAVLMFMLVFMVMMAALTLFVMMMVMTFAVLALFIVVMMAALTLFIMVVMMAALIMVFMMVLFRLFGETLELGPKAVALFHGGEKLSSVQLLPLGARRPHPASRAAAPCARG